MSSTDLRGIVPDGSRWCRLRGVAVPTERLRLLLLWGSQTVRSFADWCLRAAVVTLVVRADQWPSFLFSIFLLVASFIVLTPLTGSFSNARPRRGVLAQAAGFVVFELLLFVIVPPVGQEWGWLVWMTTIGAAFYQSAFYAMLPAAADDSHSTLPRVNGWMALAPWRRWLAAPCTPGLSARAACRPSWAPSWC